MPTLATLHENAVAVDAMRKMLSQAEHPSCPDDAAAGYADEISALALRLAVEHDKRGQDVDADLAHDIYNAARWGMFSEIRSSIDNYDRGV